MVEGIFKICEKKQVLLCYVIPLYFLSFFLFFLVFFLSFLSLTFLPFLSLLPHFVVFFNLDDNPLASTVRGGGEAMIYRQYHRYKIQMWWLHIIIDCLFRFKCFPLQNVCVADSIGMWCPISFFTGKNIFLVIEQGNESKGIAEV